MAATVPVKAGTTANNASNSSVSWPMSYTAGLGIQLVVNQNNVSNGPQPASNPNQTADQRSAIARPTNILKSNRVIDLDVASALSLTYSGLFSFLILFGIPFMIRRFSGPRAKQGWRLRKNVKTAEDYPKSEFRVGKRTEIRPQEKLQITFTYWIHRITLRNLWGDKRMTMSQLLVMAIYISIVLVSIAYHGINIASPTRNFRRFGLVAVAQLPLLFALSMRNNPSGLFGLGYERVNFLHRLVGRSLALVALAHGVLVLNLQAVPLSVALARPVFMYGAIALGALLLMSLSSISPIRARVYQIFTMIHIAGYIVFLWALWKHVATSHTYIYVSGVFMLVDRLLRVCNTRWKSAHFTSLPGSVTMVEVTETGTGWKSGQHVFLRVYSPKYMFEEHPFTIANAPASFSPYGTNNTLILVAKAHGDYSRKIHRFGLTKAALAPDLAGSYMDLSFSQEFKGSEAGLLKATMNSELTVSVEGPYGTMAVDMRSHETVILIASGIGITFCISLLEELVGSTLRDACVTRRIVLVWTLKDIDMLEAFISPIQETLRVARELQLNVSLKLHATSSMGTFVPEPLPELSVTSSRPNIVNIVTEAVNSTISAVDTRGAERGSGVAVAVCTAVDSLLQAVRKTILDYDQLVVHKVGGIELHLETFGNG